MTANEKLLRQVESHPYPLVFATISGAHLYGFPSPDSDFDLRGVHLLPLEDVVGLQAGRETVDPIFPKTQAARRRCTISSCGSVCRNVGHVRRSAFC